MRRPKLNETGIVAGLLRKSKVRYPPECATPEQRREYEDGLVRTRQAELTADAARDGEIIETWYIDMDISGREHAEGARRGLSALRDDARAGRVRLVYTRDLSRIFRSVRRQEDFFAEMKTLGCRVRAQDIPQVADEATQDWLRQNLGSFYEFVAKRGGATVRALQRAAVEDGQWVGRIRSQWGLAYNPRTKAFDFDAATADRAVLLFETLAECRGFMTAAARRLNALLDSGHPRGTATPHGARWTADAVRRIANDPLYRRATTWEGDDGLPALRLDRPDMIPEVVPTALVAEVDRLLALRAPVNADVVRKQKAGRLEYTYGPLLRCGCCGGRMRAWKDPASYTYHNPNAGQGEPPRWLRWLCCRSAVADELCPDSFSIQQRRLDLVVGQGLREALALYADKHYESLPDGSRRIRYSGADAAREADKDALERALRAVDERRDRVLDLWESRILDDTTALQKRLERIAAERSALESRRAALTLAGDAPDEPAAPRLAPADWLRLSQSLDALWSGAPIDHATHHDEPLNVGKHEMLKELGVTISVRVLPRPARQRKKGNTRQYGGLLTITLSVARLNLTGPRALAVAESEEALKRWMNWRTRVAQQCNPRNNPDLTPNLPNSPDKL